MADLTLEKEPQTAEYLQEKQTHEEKMHANYERLLMMTKAPAREPAPPVREKIQAPRPVPQRPLEPAPESAQREPVRHESADYAAQRLASYKGYRAKEESVSYEGYGRPAVSADEYAYSASARTEEPRTVYASVGAAAAPSREDALPTARTMRYGKAEVKEEGTGFFSALSSKLKAALFAVAAAIVVTIIFVCVNTAILGSLDASNSNRQLRLNQVIQQTRQIEQRIDSLTDPDNVTEWAQGHGMVRGE